jgi:dTDP-glucose 4,6-dehydratase
MLLVKDQEHIITHSKELWEELRGKSIFVTGGTGFFGKWLLESFLLVNQSFELNSNIVVLTRNSQSFLNGFPHF